MPRRRIASALALALAGAALAAAAPAAGGAVFTVASKADSGPGSLRAAVGAANANGNPAEPDRIEFAVTGAMTLAGPLPAITQPVVLDGCNGARPARRPCVWLRAPAGQGFDGLRVEADDAEVRGLAITHMRTGLVHAPGASGIVLSNLWLGVGLDGTSPGNSVGLDLAGTGGTVGVDPGATTRTGRNVVAASGQAGVRMTGSFYALRGNLLGTNVDGDHLPGHGPGVLLRAPASENVVGGDTLLEENTIVTADAAAIRIEGSGAHRNHVLSNRGQAAGPFIDLAPPFGTGNDLLTGPNGGAQAPVVLAASTESAAGVSSPNASIRLYRRPGPDPGVIEVPVARATADANGAWSVTYPRRIPPGGQVVATQTHPAQGTSELSEPVSHADVTAPNTVITAAPPSASPNPPPPISFTASEPGASFACRLDTADFAPCTSPVGLPVLKTGAHVFQVRAADAAGNADVSPAVARFGIRSGAASASRRGPTVFAFWVKRKVFRARGGATAGSAAVGTEFRFSVNAPGRAAIRLTRRAAGRRAGRRCVRPTRTNRNGPRCVRRATVTVLRMPSKKGLNKRYFRGRVRGRPLAAATYRATLVVTGEDGARSRRKRVELRVAG